MMAAGSAQAHSLHGSVRPTSCLRDEVAQAFSSIGTLSQADPQYRQRDQQADLADAVAEALDHRSVLVAETLVLANRPQRGSLYDADTLLLSPDRPDLLRTLELPPLLREVDRIDFELERSSGGGTGVNGMSAHFGALAVF